MIVCVQTIGEPELPRLLHSLGAQTDRDFDLHVFEEWPDGFHLKIDFDIGRRIVVHHLELPYSYARARNEYFGHAASNEWIVVLDPDEIVDLDFIQQVKKIIEVSPSLEIIWVPRVNMTHDGNEAEPPAIDWQNIKGFAYPDYQGRIYRNNGRLIWRGIVHEQLTDSDTARHAVARGKALHIIHHKRNQSYQQLVQRRSRIVGNLLGNPPDFQSIFVENSFKLPLPMSGARVLDLTAGYGTFAAACLERAAGQVVAIESDPVKFATLKKLAEAAGERIVIHDDPSMFKRNYHFTHIREGEKLITT